MIMMIKIILVSHFHDMTIDYCNIHIGTYLIACRGVLYHDTYYGRGICNMGDATKIIKEWACRNKKWAKCGRELNTAWFQLSRFFGFCLWWEGSVSWHRAAGRAYHRRNLLPTAALEIIFSSNEDTFGCSTATAPLSRHQAFKITFQSNGGRQISQWVHLFSLFTVNYCPLALA